MIVEHIAELAKTYEITAILYDPAGMGTLLTQLVEVGYPMVEVRQGFMSLGPACREFEKVVVTKHLFHSRDPVLTYAVSNLIWRYDANGTPAPDKRAGTTGVRKIDPVVALLDALSMAMFDVADDNQPGISSFSLKEG
jgi:phage terminase large subunit-like protein